MHHAEAAKCIRFTSFSAFLEGYRVFAAYSHLQSKVHWFHRCCNGKKGSMLFMINEMVAITKILLVPSITWIPSLLSAKALGFKQEKYFCNLMVPGTNYSRQDKSRCSQKVSYWFQKINLDRYLFYEPYYTHVCFISFHSITNFSISFMFWLKFNKSDGAHIAASYWVGTLFQNWN